MLQIKTILNRLDYSTFFDNEVNVALRDGWTCLLYTSRCV